MDANRPKVGVGVAIRKDGKVLIGKRRNAHGDGSWSFPGGHLEFGEKWDECALREISEEVGIKTTTPIFGTVTNDIFTLENKHYITIIMVADYVSGDVKILEPEKCEKWDWFAWNNLPEPLFVPLMNALNQGFDPFNSMNAARK